MKKANHLLVLSALLLGSALLSGCMTTQNYEGVREAVKGSPSLRQEGIEKCVRDMRMTPENRRFGAALMNISPRDNVERTACTRMMAGLVSGKLQHEDIYAVPFRITPKLVQVLQNR